MLAALGYPAEEVRDAPQARVWGVEGRGEAGGAEGVRDTPQARSREGRAAGGEEAGDVESEGRGRRRQGDG